MSDNFIETESLFSTKTFTILQSLYDNNSRDFYLEHKKDFQQTVENPLWRLFDRVSEQLPNHILQQINPPHPCLGRLNKWNGKMWDYGGRFYFKGENQISDTHLFITINSQRLHCGFSIHGFEFGEYYVVVDERKQFIRNCQENYETLTNILRDNLADSSLTYGDSWDDEVPIHTWEDCLKNPREVGIHVFAYLHKNKLLHYSNNRIVSFIVRTFIRIFPLVLLAISNDPIPAILKCVNKPIYDLGKCAEETGFEESELERWVRAINRKGQAIIQGPPGTGKTYIAEKLARHLIGGGDGFTELVQFHPAYSYEDFMQGMRPQTGTNGQLTYPVVPGRFLEFCKKAESRKGLCVLIIDEINRANLSQVFGELMYLLEYRDKIIPLAGSSEPFGIPENVRILGTMNTADRSIALVDHALRRRFAFINLYPNYEVLRRYHQKTGFPVEGLIKILEKLNQNIDDPHYQLGISFFLTNNLADELEDIWRMEIEPYLEEYFFDRRDKVEEFRWDKVAIKIAQ